MSTAAVVESEKLFCDEEDEILSRTKTRAERLAEKLFRRYALSDAIVENYSKLDHNWVEQQLQLRYLFRLVRLAMVNNTSVWSKLWSVLEDEGESELMEFLRESSSEETSLNLTHLKWLCSELVSVSPNWEMLGTALYLPRHVIQNSRANSNLQSLTNLLENWLIGTGKGQVACTITALAKVLQGPFINEFTLAKEVLHNYAVLKTPRKSHMNKIDNSSSSKFTITCQNSCNIRVRDGKSTILLAKASPKENVSYQWNKDGLPLLDTNCYSGVNTDLLVINAHQGTEGVYSCTLRSHELQKEVSSNKVCVKNIYMPEKEVLLLLYPCYGQSLKIWPPVRSQHFIQPSLFKLNRPFNDNASERNIGTVFQEQLQYEDLFNEVAALIVVEGFPGCGKTTLARQVVNDWVKGKVLQKMELVFYVALCKEHYDESTTLRSMLQKFYSSTQHIEAVISYIERKGGENVCFVFDELDRFHPPNKHRSIVYRLLDKAYLPRAMVVVFSRPGALMELKRDVAKHVKVFGFSREQIFQYIEAFPSEHSSWRINLKQYLELNPSVLEMCTLPLHAETVCFLCSQLKVQLPSTLTEFYCKFVQTVILHYLKLYDQEVELLSLDDLDEFTELCKLAYETTVNWKVFKEKDIQLEDKSDWFLSFLACDHTVQILGICTTFKFVYRSLQTFLAAYHVARSSLEDKASILNMINSKLCKDEFFTFYFGLDRSLTEKQLKSEAYRNILKSVSGFKYAYESQQSLVCDKVLALSDGDVKVWEGEARDVLALGYFIHKTSKQIKELAVQFDLIVDFDSLLEQICHTKFPMLNTLNLQSTITNSRSLNNVANIMQSCGEISCASFIFSNLLFEVQDFAEQLKGCTQLEHLDLLCLQAGDDLSCGMSPVIQSICSLSKLKELNFSRWRIDLACFEELAASFDGIVNLEILFLVDNHITSDAAVSIVSALCKLEKLRKLNLAGNSIGTEGAIRLASAIPDLTNLETLDLTGNLIGSDGAIELSSKLHQLVYLQDLLLSGNNIDKRAVEQVSKTALKSCPMLNLIVFQ